MLRSAALLWAVSGPNPQGRGEAAEEVCHHGQRDAPSKHCVFTSPFNAVLAAARNRLGGVFVWGVRFDDHFLAIEKHGQDTTPTVLEGRVLVMGFRSSFQ